LFIERDSKHRRIFSNFGLTFRNSKWSPHSKTNVNFKFKNAYLKNCLSFFFIFIFLVASWNGSNYYIRSFFFNNLIFIFWMSLDSFDYYASFGIWLITITLASIFNLVYSYFFFNNFSVTQRKQIRNFHVTGLKSESASANNSFISKNDLNWVLYIWLTRSKNLDSVFIEKLFESNVAQWDKLYDFFIKLYRVVYFTNLLNPSFSLTHLSHLSRRDLTISANCANSLIPYFNNTLFTKSSAGLILNFNLNVLSNYFNLKNNNFQYNYNNSRTSWNLYSIESENFKNTFLIKSKIGLFYNFLTYEKYNNLFFNYSELWGLNFFLKNQVTSAKWTRWLYRYSVIHRKSLKNAHKLTIAKRLVNSGFYNNSFFYRNIWNSEYFSRSLNRSDISNFFNNLYKNIYTLNFPNANDGTSRNLGYQINQKLILENLSSIENSFFFFLKRFYLFNNLSTSAVTSSYVALNKIPDLQTLISFKTNAANKQFFLLSYFLQNKLLVQNLISTDYVKIPLDENTLTNRPESFFLKDILFVSGDNDLFTNSILSILENVTLADSLSSSLAISNYRVVAIEDGSSAAKIYRNKFKKSSSRTARLSDLRFNNYLINSMFLDQTFLKDLYAATKIFN